MSLDNQKIYNHLLEVANNSNVESIYREIIESIYEESKFYIFMLMGVLLLFSVVGSVANTFVLFVFKMIFDKHFNRKIQSKLAATSSYRDKIYEKISSTKEEDLINVKVLYRDQDDQKTIKLYENYNNVKKKLIFNTNIYLFYSLIRYLAFVDLFTCSIAIPATIYEIFYNMKINEFSCKLFEFLRAFGVITSNFIIILIAVERYKALKKLSNFKFVFFKFCIFSIILISLIISGFCMLQVSTYQKVANSIIHIGMCFKSENFFISNYNKALSIIIVTFFVCGIISVSIIHVLIFRRCVTLNKRYKIGKESENRMLKKTVQTFKRSGEVEKLKIEIRRNIVNKILARRNKEAAKVRADLPLCDALFKWNFSFVCVENGILLLDK